MLPLPKQILQNKLWQSSLNKSSYILKRICIKEASGTYNFFHLYGKRGINLLAAGASRMAQASHDEIVKDYHTELGSVSGNPTPSPAVHQFQQPEKKAKESCSGNN